MVGSIMKVHERLVVTLEWTNHGYRLNVQARTDPHESMDIDDTVWYESCPDAVRSAGLNLQLLARRFHADPTRAAS